MGHDTHQPVLKVRVINGASRRNRGFVGLAGGCIRREDEGAHVDDFGEIDVQRRLFGAGVHEPLQMDHKVGRIRHKHVAAGGLGLLFAGRALIVAGLLGRDQGLYGVVQRACGVGNVDTHHGITLVERLCGLALAALADPARPAAKQLGDVGLDGVPADFGGLELHVREHPQQELVGVLLLPAGEGLCEAGDVGDDPAEGGGHFALHVSLTGALELAQETVLTPLDCASTVLSGVYTFQ